MKNYMPGSSLDSIPKALVGVIEKKCPEVLGYESTLTLIQSYIFQIDYSSEEDLEIIAQKVAEKSKNLEFEDLEELINAIEACKSIVEVNGFYDSEQVDMFLNNKARHILEMMTAVSEVV